MYCNGDKKNNTTKPIKTAAMIDTNWVLPPLASLTAVRDEVPLTTNP